ncbi:hypothetical protein D3C76_1553230 [compost metagenome]
MRIAQRIDVGLENAPALADAFTIQINQADVQYIFILVGLPVKGKGLKNILGFLIGFRLREEKVDRLGIVAQLQQPFSVLEQIINVRAEHIRLKDT